MSITRTRYTSVTQPTNVYAPIVFYRVRRRWAKRDNAKTVTIIRRSHVDITVITIWQRLRDSDGFVRNSRRVLVRCSTNQRGAQRSCFINFDNFRAARRTPYAASTRSASQPSPRTRAENFTNFRARVSYFFVCFTATPFSRIITSYTIRRDIINIYVGICTV